MATKTPLNNMCRVLSRLPLIQRDTSLEHPTYSECESSARRIAALGAGYSVLPESNITGRKKQVSAEAVHTKVHDILSKASLTENAKWASERMRAYDDASEAARLIECFS